MHTRRFFLDTRSPPPNINRRKKWRQRCEEAGDLRGLPAVVLTYLEIFHGGQRYEYRQWKVRVLFRWTSFYADFEVEQLMYSDEVE